MIKLNETPLRTSRNFNINNVKLEEVEIPELKENDEVQNIELTYGLGDFFTNQVSQKATKRMHFDINKENQENPVICFEFDENNLHLVEDIVINVNENANSTVIIKYVSKNDLKCYHNGILKVNAKKNAKIDIIFVNLLNTNSDHFMAIENCLEEKATVNYYIIDFGGKNSITNYYSNLIGREAKNTVNTIYLGKNDQMFDMNYIGHLRGEKSDISITIQGALKNKAKKHFKGTIDFKRGCKKAVGNENDVCMLLSDTAKSISLPMLLCSEEEVEGNHSSSAGKIEEKELFYMMSRGFELKEAQKLMVRAKFNEVLEKIQDEDLKNLIFEEIDKRLN